MAQLNIEDTRSLIVKAFANRHIGVTLEVIEKKDLYFCIIDLPEVEIERYEKKYGQAFAEIREKLDPFWIRNEDHFSNADKMLYVWLFKESKPEQDVTAE